MIAIRKTCEVLRIALMLVILSASVGQCHADQAPWFDEFLVRFPDALLLEEEPFRLPPAADSTPIDSVRTSPIKQLASAELVETPQAVAPAARRPAPSHSCPDSRRYVFSDGRTCSCCEYWQILPAGVMYPSYVAGEKEPRMGTAILQEKDRGPILESIIGGRMGLLRYGTPGPINPQGFEWDLESAAMLRQDFDEELDVEATDFRIGSVLTWKRGPTAVKGGMYHLSSHVGDEYLERNPMFVRRNYSRDVLLVGVYHYVVPELAVYGEIGYAVRNDGGSEPIELQFGAEYSSLSTVDPGGGPFAAINVHMREEFDYGGALNILAGWEWRGPLSNRRFRVGGQYYTGKEIQWSFFDENITLYGAGIWYDF